MTTEWRTCCLEELAAPGPHSLATGPFGSAVSAKNFRDSGVPMIRGKNLSTDVGKRLVDGFWVFLDPELGRQYRRSLATDGDLVFTCWGTVGQVGLIDRGSRFGEYIVSNKQMKLTPDPSKADSLFLYYLLSQPSMIAAVAGDSIGSSVPGFNLGQLRRLRVHVPDLAGQRRIAGVLGAFDDLIDTNTWLASSLRKSRWAAVERAAGESDEVYPLGQIASLVNDRVMPSEVSEEIPYLGLEHFAQGGGGIEAVGSVRGTDSTKSRFRAGDVLYGKLRPYFRKVDRPNFEGVCSTEIWVLRAISPVLASVLEWAVASPAFTAHASSASEGTRMPRANWNHVSTFEVAVPPAAARESLNAQLNSMYEMEWALRIEANQLAKIRDELLPLLMSGRITVDEAWESVS